MMLTSAVQTPPTPEEARCAFGITPLPGPPGPRAHGLWSDDLICTRVPLFAENSCFKGGLFQVPSNSVIPTS